MGPVAARNTWATARKDSQLCSSGSVLLITARNKLVAARNHVLSQVFVQVWFIRFVLFETVLTQHI